MKIAYSLPLQAVHSGSFIAGTQVLVSGTVAALVASAWPWTLATPAKQRWTTRVVAFALMAGAVLTPLFAWQPGRFF